MVIHTEQLLTIAFGDARTAFNPRDYRAVSMDFLLDDINKKSSLDTFMPLKKLVFLHQIHSADGFCITSQDQAETMQPFVYEGDFLITNVAHIGLAIVTADCLPIILYDKRNHIVALIHAGWRGSIKGIAYKALQRMQTIFGTQPESVRTFFGPSAKVCCYQVGVDVQEALDAFSCKDTVLVSHKGTDYFDLPLFNKLQLEAKGIIKQTAVMAYNVCTIENNLFCSYRRQKDSSGNRQITIVALK